MAIVTCNAIILSKKAFFEHDIRCECFSDSLGKITCLAKYINRPKSKKLWALEPLTYVKLTLFKGKSFYIIQNYSTLKPYEQIRTSFNHLQYALFFSQIIKKSTQNEQLNPSLFNLLQHVLKECNNLNPLDKIKNYFYINYLNYEGITPQNTHSTTETYYLKTISNYIHFQLKKPLQLDVHTTYPVK